MVYVFVFLEEKSKLTLCKRDSLLTTSTASTAHQSIGKRKIDDGDKTLLYEKLEVTVSCDGQ